MVEGVALFGAGEHDGGDVGGGVDGVFEGGEGGGLGGSHDLLLLLLIQRWESERNKKNDEEYHSR